jgi:hypothetical protein
VAGTRVRIRALRCKLPAMLPVGRPPRPLAIRDTSPSGAALSRSFCAPSESRLIDRARSAPAAGKLRVLCPRAGPAGLSPKWEVSNGHYARRVRLRHQGLKKMNAKRSFSLAIKRAQTKCAQAKLRKQREIDYPKPKLVARNDRPGGDEADQRERSQEASGPATERSNSRREILHSPFALILIAPCTSA